MRNLEKLKARMSGEGVEKYIGDIVFWAVSDVALTRSDLLRIFIEEQLDVTLVPGDNDDLVAFRRAVNKARAEAETTAKKAKARYEYGETLSPIGEDDQTIQWGVVREGVSVQSGQKELDVSSADTILFYKATGTIAYAGSSGVAGRVVDLYEANRGRFTSADVLSMLVSIMGKWDAIPVRERGGIYFVPATWTEHVQRLARAVGRIGTSSLGVLNIAGTVQSQTTLRESAMIVLEQSINDIMRDIESFDDKTRQGTVERRIIAVRELKDRVELYSDLLEFNRESVMARLEAVEKKTRELLLAY